MGKEDSKVEGGRRQRVIKSAKHVHNVKSFKFVDKISCWYTNADQLKNKFSEFQVRVRDQKPMIIGITEVKPKNCTNYPVPAEYNMEWNKEYKVFHLNLQSEKGRGLLLYVHNSLNADEVKMATEFEENLFVKIRVNNQEYLLIGLIYRSPSDNSEITNSKLRELIVEAANMKSTHHLIMGDFNYPAINWATLTTRSEQSEEQKFIECLEDSFLFQIITNPTRWRGTDTPTVLDLIITGDEGNIDDLEHQSPLGKSDHCVLVFNLICQTRINDTIKERRCYHKGNYEGIRKEMKNFNWSEYLNNSKDIDTMWAKLQSKLVELEEKFIPMAKIGGKKCSMPLDKETLLVIKEKNRLSRKFVKTKDENVRKLYTRKRNKATKLVRRARKNYEKRLAQDAKNNPKKVWQYINLKSKTRQGVSELCTDLHDPKSTKTDNDTEKADILAEFFSSVFTKESENQVPELKKKQIKSQWKDIVMDTEKIDKILKDLKPNKSPGLDNIHPRLLKELYHELSYPLSIIFSKSLKDKTVPQEWKKARVSAIYKKGSKSIAGNYRPVSLTSVACKVMEKLLRDHIIQFMEANHFFSDKQYGFMTGRSTSLQLLKVLDEWTEAIDNGMEIDCMYMDYKKAFDTVPHKRLIKKLEAYGIGGDLTAWLQNYLTDRFQQVSVNGKTSKWHKVTSGVPQGSVIGPLMFVIFINDLPDLVKSSIYLFADDTKMFRIIQSDNDRQALQLDLNKLNEWTETWLLKLHPEKCKYIHLQSGRKELASEFEYELAGNKLERVKEEKDIGVIIDENLNFESHIAEKVKKANSMFAMIRRIFAYLNSNNFTPLYKTLVRTHLDYASSVWAPHKTRHIEMIEGVQRRATKQIPGFTNLTYQERLQRLKLPTLKYRRLRGDMIEVYKILNGIYDPRSGNMLKLNCHMSDRSGNRGNSLKLFTQRAKLDVRKYSFSIRVAKTWNSLPDTIVTAKSLNSFKNKLDAHWKNQEVMYDYRADINTGSHTVIEDDLNEESSIEDPEGTCIGKQP